MAPKLRVDLVDDALAIVFGSQLTGTCEARSTMSYRLLDDQLFRTVLELVRWQIVERVVQPQHVRDAEGVASISFGRGKELVDRVLELDEHRRAPRRLELPFCHLPSEMDF